MNHPGPLLCPSILSETLLLPCTPPLLDQAICSSKSPCLSCMIRWQTDPYSRGTLRHSLPNGPRRERNVIELTQNGRGRILPPNSYVTATLIRQRMSIRAVEPACLFHCPSALSTNNQIWQVSQSLEFRTRSCTWAFEQAWSPSLMSLTHEPVTRDARIS